MGGVHPPTPYTPDARFNRLDWGDPASNLRIIAGCGMMGLPLDMRVADTTSLEVWDMAKVATVAKRAAGTRVVAFLIDNQMELDIPEEADVLADALLDNDEPDESSSGNSYKLRYASFADPNNPHMVAARVGGKTLTAPIGGQLLITLSKKAIEQAARRSS